MKNKKTIKKKVLISLDPEVYECLERETKEQGIGKSQLIQRLILNNIENRLSKYILRDVENLLLYLIFAIKKDQIQKININRNKLIEDIEKVLKESKKIESAKAIFLKNEREKKKEELKTFWNKILNLLEPKNFVNKISVNGKVDEKKIKNFIKELYLLVKENKKLWDK